MAKAFDGGYTIKLDGQVIGGVGVSGGHYSQEMEVAQAALAAADSALTSGR